MRLLKFNVNSQRISKDPECDFSNLVSGTSGYVRAKFNFSSEWDGYNKTARFFRGHNEHTVPLDSNNECYIPTEVLTGQSFRVGVIMRRGTSRIPTNQINVRQEVSR